MHSCCLECTLTLSPKLVRISRRLGDADARMYLLLVQGVQVLENHGVAVLYNLRLSLQYHSQVLARSERYTSDGAEHSARCSIAYTSFDGCKALQGRELKQSDATGTGVSPGDSTRQLLLRAHNAESRPWSAAWPRLALAVAVALAGACALTVDAARVYRSSSGSSGDHHDAGSISATTSTQQPHNNLLKCNTCTLRCH